MTLRRAETRRPPETHDESSVKSAKNRPDHQDITLATLIILINTMIMRLDKPQNVVGFLQKKAFSKALTTFSSNRQKTSYGDSKKQNPV